MASLAVNAVKVLLLANWLMFLEGFFFAAWLTDWFPLLFLVFLRATP